MSNTSCPPTAPEVIDAAHEEALIEDWLLDRRKARKLAREIDAAHDFALDEEAFRATPVTEWRYPERHHSSHCRVCGRLPTRGELVELTHPIFLCSDCRGVEEM